MRARLGPCSPLRSSAYRKYASSLRGLRAGRDGPSSRDRPPARGSRLASLVCSRILMPPPTSPPAGSSWLRAIFFFTALVFRAPFARTRSAGGGAEGLRILVSGAERSDGDTPYSRRGGGNRGSGVRPGPRAVHAGRGLGSGLSATGMLRKDLTPAPRPEWRARAETGPDRAIAYGAGYLGCKCGSTARLRCLREERYHEGKRISSAPAADRLHQPQSCLRNSSQVTLSPCCWV